MAMPPPGPACEREIHMSEPATPHPDPSPAARPPSSPNGVVPPMPYPGTTTAQPPSSPDGAVPPMPSEATNAAGRWHMAMMPLRKMMRRPPRDAV